jgi:Flp pilus assembly protein TadB
MSDTSLALAPTSAPATGGSIVDYAVFRTRTTTTTRSGGFLSILVRLLAVAAAGIALLAMMLIGLFIVLPLLLAGGTALYLYLRRRLRQARPRQQDGVIDAEYTIIERQ